MDGFQFVASLVSSLAWPIIIAVAMLLFRPQIAELIGRLRSVKALGAEGTFDPKSAAARVAIATATASASAQSVAMIARPEAERAPVAERLRDLAVASPQAAVLQAYEEVERALRQRMRNANVADVDKLADYALVDVALQRGVITRETMEGLRGILVLRNMAAHDRDVDAAKALDYLGLADAMVYAIEVTRAYAGAASGTGTAHDATVETREGP